MFFDKGEVGRACMPGTVDLRKERPPEIMHLHKIPFPKTGAERGVAMHVCSTMTKTPYRIQTCSLRSC